MRSARVERKTDRPIAVACWIDEDGNPLEPPEPIEPSQALGDLSHWLAHQVESAGEIHATAGPRLGPPPERTRRTGSSEEVIAPMHLRPQAAVKAVRRGGAFDRPLRHMRLHRDSFATNGVSLTWLTTLRTGLFRRRAATLRIGPSPSGNLTVLQLVPQKPRRYRTGAFVQAGLPAVDEICDRLAHANQSSITQG